MLLISGKFPWLIYFISIIFSQPTCAMSRQKEFNFDCIKITAEPNGNGKNGKNPLNLDGIVEEQIGRQNKKLKGKIFAKKPVHGYVQNIGYPNEGYSNFNGKCAIELEASNRNGLILQITFIDLDLEPRYSRSGQCLRDYLVLTIIDRDGREHTSERICGKERPSPVRTMQSKARLMFVVSSTSSLLNAHNSTAISKRKRGGFKIRYEFVPEATILAPSSLYFDPETRFRVECGGVNSPTALSGEIRSPGFPSTYPRNVTCYWLLRVAEHRRLYIRILDLELSPTVAECDRASLHLLDGYRHDLQHKHQQQQSSETDSDSEDSWATAIVSSTGSKKRIAKGGGTGATDADFCGSSEYYGEEGMKSYLSEGNRVVIKFVTTDGPTNEQLANYTNSRKPIGFRLLWTEVDSLVATASDVPSQLGDEPDPEHPSIIVAEQCPGFVCLGGTFCMDDFDSICIERTRLCINETLRCNGVSNCAENDDSDEEYCYSQNPVSFSAFALLLIGLILLLLSITYCILRHLNRSRRPKQQGRMALSRLEDESIRREEGGRESCRMNGGRGRDEGRGGGGGRSANGQANGGRNMTRNNDELMRRPTPEEEYEGDEEMMETIRRKRRLSDTRMRKLQVQIPSVSSMVVVAQQQEKKDVVRTNVIPATPPILMATVANNDNEEEEEDDLPYYGWKELRDMQKHGEIAIQEWDLVERDLQNVETKMRELPCLCPIQKGANANSGGNGPPKVRLMFGKNQAFGQHCTGDGAAEIWQRRNVPGIAGPLLDDGGTAAATANGKMMILMESLS